MSVIMGQSFLVYAGGTSSANKVAYSRTCSVKVDAEMQEISSPLTGVWKTYIPQKSGWTISVAGLVDSSRNDRTLFNLLDAREAVTVYYKNENDGHYYYGSAYLKSLQQTAENRKLSTYTAEFQGTGQLYSL